MKKCPKCSSQYGDDLKICRTCGAILEAVVEEPPPAVEKDLSPHEDDDAHEATPTEEHSWICLQCGQSVPCSFEVCWNCGTSQDGIPDLDFGKEPATENGHPWTQETSAQTAVGEQIGYPPPRCDPDFSNEPVSDNHHRMWQPTEQLAFAKQIGYQCLRCGSSKMIPNTTILDQGQASDGKLQVLVDACPDALIFKDRRYDQLIADICGDCGHVELKVEHPSELYEHYLRSKAEQERK
jgi:hypothetical protein